MFKTPADDTSSDVTSGAYRIDTVYETVFDANDLDRLFLKCVQVFRSEGRHVLESGERFPFGWFDTEPSQGVCVCVCVLYDMCAYACVQAFVCVFPPLPLSDIHV